MDLLPTETKMYLFSFLEGGDKLFARLVCSEWRELLPFGKSTLPEKNIVRFVAERGYLELLCYLIDHVACDEILAEEVVRAGNMTLIRHIDSLFTLNNLRYIKHNPLEVLKFFLEEKGVWYDNNIFCFALEDVKALEYVWPKINVDISGLNKAAQLTENPEVLRWLKEKGAQFSENHCIRLIEKDNVEMLKAWGPLPYGTVLRLIQESVCRVAPKCLVYLDSLINIGTERKQSICRRYSFRSNSEMTKVLLEHSYMTHRQAYMRTAIDDNPDYELLAWLRGEREKKWDPLPEWPECVTDVIMDNIPLLTWMFSKDRIHGRHPWNSNFLPMCIINAHLKTIKWARNWRIHGKDVCPWNAGCMGYALQKENREIILFMRDEEEHGLDVCPWPNMKEFTPSDDFREWLKGLGCPLE